MPNSHQNRLSTDDSEFCQHNERRCIICVPVPCVDLSIYPDSLNSIVDIICFLWKLHRDKEKLSNLINVHREVTLWRIIAKYVYFDATCLMGRVRLASLRVCHREFWACMYNVYTTYDVLNGVKKNSLRHDVVSWFWSERFLFPVFTCSEGFIMLMIGNDLADYKSLSNFTYYVHL